MYNGHLLANRRKNLNATLIFFLSLVAAGVILFCLVFASIRSEQEETRKIALFYGEHFTQKISLLLKSLSQTLNPMYVMLILHQGDVAHFESVAEYLVSANPNIININLAKDGIVSKVFPYQRNRDALGHNLLQAENRKQEALLARESQKITLSGPFNLVQGGMGLAFRQPIFLASQEDPRHKTFWGFSIVTYRFPEVLHSKLDFGILSTAGFSWDLWRHDPVTGQRSSLIHSALPLVEKAQTHTIPLPNTTWYLDLCPVNGWLDWNRLFLFLYLAIPLCILFATAMMQFAILYNKNNEILLQSKIDYLTKLYNKETFWKIFESALKKHLKRIYAENAPRLFLCVFDLNNFKQINDTYGHLAGDKVLAEFARRLSQKLTCKDFASRFGGDEFVAALYCIPDQLQRLPGKIIELKKELEGIYDIDGNSVPVSVSTGAISPACDMLAEKREHLTAGEFFLEKVDLAMYAEKHLFHIRKNTCPPHKCEER